MKKNIIYVIPGYGRHPIGGHKTIYMHASYLASLGCDVTICFLCSNSFKKYHFPEILRKMICKVLTQYYPRWYKINSSVVKRCIFTIDDASIPQGTDVVATAVETANPVAQLNPGLWKKHYLIQGFEVWAEPECQVRSTYRLGMSNIVVSSWLEKLVRDECGVEPRLIKNPIDIHAFYPEPGIYRQPHEIACLYHESEYKGFQDLYEALEIVKASVPDLVVNIFGGPRRPKWLPQWFHYTQSANQSQLRQIYSRSTIFACATVNEGFGLTLPESMFCGCALASTRFQGVWEYADENCAKLSPIHDPEALAANIIAMLEDPEGTSALAEKGREHAMKECSVEKAQQALRKEFELE